jgi:hypothetical protein
MIEDVRKKVVRLERIKRDAVAVREKPQILAVQEKR